MQPMVRVVDARLGPSAQVRVVVSGIDEPEPLRAAWASSGAAVEVFDGRLTAVSTVAALARAAGRALDPTTASQLRQAAERAVAAWTSPTPPWQLPGGAELDLSERPAVMGVLNVTPDSFADGGQVYPEGHPAAAVAKGRAQAAAGAAIIDVGGESARPGSMPIAVDEELRRVVPVVEALAAEGHMVSVDTVKPEVARQAVQAGAALVNDVGAGSPDMLETVAGLGCGYVLMHTRGTPADMHEHTDYADVVAEVYERQWADLDRCLAAGIPREGIVLDPGIGFAKTATQSAALVAAVPQLRSLGRPVLVGASRKSFLGALLDGAPVEERLEGSLAVAAVAAVDRAGIVRAHDVGETVRTIRVAAALRKA